MKNKIKNIVILGSTGSIGKNTLEVISRYPHKFKVRALTAHSNVNLLSKQIEKVSPDIAVITDENKFKDLKGRTLKTKTKILCGPDGLNEIIRDKRADIIMVAMAGAGALKPLITALEAKKDIALANKESLVMAGDIIMAKVKKNRIKLIPVDSEHSAIFQCLQANSDKELKRIYITGSGGALDKVPKSRFKEVTPKRALSHPKWKMGKKITVDSATLMNKGLEVIEAMYLFNMPLDKIKVLIHPEAVIHSMVEFIDSSILAQMALADMRLPIQYALSFPERFTSSVASLDFSKYSKLTFKLPDVGKFPCLKLAYKAAEKGRTYPCALNAANEEVVHAFLLNKIRLTEIPKIIEKVLSLHKPIKTPKLSDILEVDNLTRELTKELIEKKKG